MLIQSLESVNAVAGRLTLHIQGIAADAERLLVAALQRLLIVNYMHG